MLWAGKATLASPDRHAPHREILRLAYRDFAHERRISLCFVLALMAVLAPLLILFGLKFGLVDTLAQRLVESPANREVLAVGSRQYRRGLVRPDRRPGRTWPSWSPIPGGSPPA